jgi:hypothetical protein
MIAVDNDVLVMHVIDAAFAKLWANQSVRTPARRIALVMSSKSMTP